MLGWVEELPPRCSAGTMLSHSRRWPVAGGFQKCFFEGLKGLDVASQVTLFINLCWGWVSVGAGAPVALFAGPMAPGRKRPCPWVVLRGVPARLGRSDI